jgi:hypothetical protein
MAQPALHPFITFVPFSTSLMGQYRSLDDAPLVYGINPPSSPHSS